MSEQYKEINERAFLLGQGTASVGVTIENYGAELGDPIEDQGLSIQLTINDGNGGVARLNFSSYEEKDLLETNNALVILTNAVNLIGDQLHKLGQQQFPEIYTKQEEAAPANAVAATPVTPEEEEYIQGLSTTLDVPARDGKEL